MPKLIRGRIPEKIPYMSIYWLSNANLNLPFLLLSNLFIVTKMKEMKYCHA